MITGELRNKIDKIWETFWTGGITNPLDVIEQFTLSIIDSPATTTLPKGAPEITAETVTIRSRSLRSIVGGAERLHHRTDIFTRIAYLH